MVIAAALAVPFYWATGPIHGTLAIWLGRVFGSFLAVLAVTWVICWVWEEFRP